VRYLTETSLSESRHLSRKGNFEKKKPRRKQSLKKKKKEGRSYYPVSGTTHRVNNGKEGDRRLRQPKMRLREPS